MPAKDTLEAEIREIVDLGKGIGRTKVIFEHFIGLRVPADIYLLPIGPILSGGNGRGPHWREPFARMPCWLSVSCAIFF